MMRCCTCRHNDVPPDQPPCVDGCESDDCPYWEEARDDNGVDSGNSV